MNPDLALSEAIAFINSIIERTPEIFSSIVESDTLPENCELTSDFSVVEAYEFADIRGLTTWREIIEWSMADLYGELLDKVLKKTTSVEVAAYKSFIVDCARTLDKVTPEIFNNDDASLFSGNMHYHLTCIAHWHALRGISDSQYMRMAGLMADAYQANFFPCGWTPDQKYPEGKLIVYKPTSVSGPPFRT